MTTPTMTDVEQAAWWNEPPRRPKLTMKAAEDVPAWITTVAITCRVCGMRDHVRIESVGLVCRQCRVDPALARIRIKGEQTKVEIAQNQALELWNAFLDNLDDATLGSWGRITQATLQATERLRSANTRPVRAGDDPMIEINAAKEALAALHAKIAKTCQAKPPVAAVVAAEQVYTAEMERLAKRLQDWDVAIQELEAATTQAP